MVRKEGDKIVFELGAFNPKDGTFYILDDGRDRLQLLVMKGRKALWKHTPKKEREEWWIRRLMLEEKILEYVMMNSKSVIALDMKVNTRFFKLLKEFDALNKESDK